MTLGAPESRCSLPTVQSHVRSGWLSFRPGPFLSARRGVVGPPLLMRKAPDESAGDLPYLVEQRLLRPVRRMPCALPCAHLAPAHVQAAPYPFFESTRRKELKAHTCPRSKSAVRLRAIVSRIQYHHATACSQRDRTGSGNAKFNMGGRWCVCCGCRLSSVAATHPTSNGSGTPIAGCLAGSPYPRMTKGCGMVRRVPSQDCRIVHAPNVV